MSTKSFSSQAHSISMTGTSFLSGRDGGILIPPHLPRDDRETKERRRRRQEGRERYPVGDGPEVCQDGRLRDRRRGKEDRWEEIEGRREGTEKVGRRVIGRQGGNRSM